MRATQLRLLAMAVVASTAIFTTGSAQASMTFNFSYQFSGGPTVSGSLDGDQNGNYVENISNISVFFNGTQMSGPMHTAMFNGSDWVNSPVVVSFDASNNNLIFINSDFLNGQPYSEYFAFRSGSVWAYSVPNSNLYAQEHVADARWSLTPAAVPEPSTYLAGALLALPFGLQGIRLLRNRRQAE
jgi:hypothetical protein